MESAAPAAYLKLADYAARCRQRATALPLQKDTVEYWRGVGFTLNQERFIVPLDEVSETLALPTCTRVPGVQSWVKGVANVRGRLMTVIDLSRFLGRVPDVQEKERRLLVMEQGDLYSGVIVDQIVGMRHFAAHDHASGPPEWASRNVRSYLSGYFHTKGDHWSVFSLLRLAQDPCFMRTARTG